MKKMRAAREGDAAERRRAAAVERWRLGRGLTRGPFREMARMEREMEDLFGGARSEATPETSRGAAGR
jgi:hypothetical protein